MLNLNVLLNGLNKCICQMHKCDKCIGQQWNVHLTDCWPTPVNRHTRPNPVFLQISKLLCQLDKHQIDQ